jgi:hypothetical protein
VSDISIFGQAAVVVALLGFLAALVRVSLRGPWSAAAARLPLDDGEVPT